MVKLHVCVKTPTNVDHGEDAQWAPLWKTPGGFDREADRVQHLKSPFKNIQEGGPGCTNAFGCAEMLCKDKRGLPFYAVEAFLDVGRTPVPVNPLCKRQLNPALNLKPDL